MFKAVQDEAIRPVSANLWLVSSSSVRLPLNIEASGKEVTRSKGLERRIEHLALGMADVVKTSFDR